MKNEKSRPEEYRPTASGPMKLYLVRHKDGREVTVNGRNRYEAVTAAARKWGVRWTSIARECEFIELASEDEEETAPWQQENSASRGAESALSGGGSPVCSLC